jgi:Glycosyltransferase family 87
MGFVIVGSVMALSLKGTNPGGRDFIEYWAVEQQLVHYGKPYDWQGVLQTEKAVGFDNARPEMWYSPPPALTLAFPLGWMSARTGLLFWLLLQFAILSGVLWVLWAIWGCPRTLLHLCGYLFAPPLLCIQAGQISIFLLAGVTLFLFLHRAHPWMAGASLLPCILKPHLFLPFAVVLTLWVIRKKAFGVLGGFVLAVGAGQLYASAFDRHAWAEYEFMMKHEGMLHEFVGTLSSALRFLIDPGASWLQFVPCAAACVWAGWYFWSRRARWGWMDQGLVLLLVSAVCAPYGWFFDESALLPALLTAVFRAKPSAKSLLPLVVLDGAALVEINASVSVMSRAYLWTTLAWLGWYLYAARFAKTVRNDSGAVVQAAATAP